MLIWGKYKFYAPTAALASSAKGVLRYRSPVEHPIVTINFPLFSGLEPPFIAAQTFAPVLMPTRIPSSAAIRLAIANASSFET